METIKLISRITWACMLSFVELVIILALIFILHHARPEAVLSFVMINSVIVLAFLIIRKWQIAGQTFWTLGDSVEFITSTLVILFATPVGWIGMIVAGTVIRFVQK